MLFSFSQQNLIGIVEKLQNMSKEEVYHEGMRLIHSCVHHMKDIYSRTYVINDISNNVLALELDKELLQALGEKSDESKIDVFKKSNDSYVVQNVIQKLLEKRELIISVDSILQNLFEVKNNLIQINSFFEVDDMIDIFVLNFTTLQSLIRQKEEKLIELEYVCRFIISRKSSFYESINPEFLLQKGYALSHMDYGESISSILPDKKKSLFSIKLEDQLKLSNLLLDTMSFQNNTVMIDYIMKNSSRVETNVMLSVVLKNRNNDTNKLFAQALQRRCFSTVNGNIDIANADNIDNDVEGFFTYVTKRFQKESNDMTNSKLLDYEAMLSEKSKQNIYYSRGFSPDEVTIGNLLHNPIETKSSQIYKTRELPTVDYISSESEECEVYEENLSSADRISIDTNSYVLELTNSSAESSLDALCDTKSFIDSEKKRSFIKSYQKGGSDIKNKTSKTILTKLPKTHMNYKKSSDTEKECPIRL